MYSVDLKKILSKPTPPKWLRRPRANLPFEILSGDFSTVCLKSIKRSVINIRRSMLDVQSVHCSGQAELHTISSRRLSAVGPLAPKLMRIYDLTHIFDIKTVLQVNG
ncbi:hypothetical protein D1BOALGB6SA_3997 [Olavius sp. associated proteobacterium Delta 1]|nr:hypothetical protein D1BOALGB6SA_3997 [Olavius sp. associated proteobacterium Delta 1]